MQKPVVVYSSAWCGYCRAAKALLQEKGMPFEEIDVDENSEMRREMMERSGRRTVPQIFFGDQHIGGYTDLYAYFQKEQQKS